MREFANGEREGLPRGDRLLIHENDDRAVRPIPLAVTLHRPRWLGERLLDVIDDVAVTEGRGGAYVADAAKSRPQIEYESVGSLRELRRAVELEACDVVNVKVAGAGGFRPARELLREARAHGLDAFLSSTLDGPWGIAAALQLAAAEELTLACGLATLQRFDSPLARALPPPRGGTLSVPGGPGLGVQVDEGELAGVTVGTLRPETR